jgi:hypothetical protein
VTAAHYCPIHEEDVGACNAECSDARAELRRLARAYSMLWLDRKRGHAAHREYKSLGAIWAVRFGKRLAVVRRITSPSYLCVNCGDQPQGRWKRLCSQCRYQHELGLWAERTAA